MNVKVLSPGAASDSPTGGRWDLPWAIFPPEAEPLCARRAAQWIWVFMVLGIAARVVRYALRFPLWGDECLLAANFVGRGYLDLTQPLENHQVAPLFYLWTELSFVKLFGYNEYSLRLFAFLTSLGSLFVFRHVAGRLLRGTALVVTFGVFAVAYPGIRYGAEVKPYGSDLFVSLALLALAVEWLRAADRTGWLWALTAATPLAIGLSYPAVFVAGGISAAVACRLWGSGRGRRWVCWGAYNLVLVGSFAAGFLLSAANQCNAALGPMQTWWKDQFPPLSSPLRLPGWLLEVHAGDLVAYPFGGRNYGSTLSLLCCVVAVGVLVRRRQWTLFSLCLTPLALNFIAAAMHRYPYGGHVRVAMYLAPIVCVLCGLGASTALAWHAARRGRSRRPVLVALALLAMLPAGSVCRDLWRPSKCVWDAQVREFARWLWSGKAAGSEVVCLKADLGRAFCPQTVAGDDSSIYFCNQQIYSPRHQERRPPDLARVSAARPLCCVRFRSTRMRYDEDAFQEWLEDMQSRYQLVAQESHPFPFYTGERLAYVHYVETYEFVPKTPGGGPVLAAGKPVGPRRR